MAVSVVISTVFTGLSDQSVVEHVYLQDGWIKEVCFLWRSFQVLYSDFSAGVKCKILLFKNLVCL